MDITLQKSFIWKMHQKDVTSGLKLQKHNIIPKIYLIVTLVWF